MIKSAKKNIDLKKQTRLTINLDGKTLCLTVTKNYVLIHGTTSFKDVTFSSLLNVKINSLTDDGSIYQVDLI